jgi:Universal stress protein family
MVDQAVSYLHARFPDVSTDVSVGAPAREIVDSARAWPADVIAVGSRNRHGVVAFALGSVSREVLLHAPCSVRATSPRPATACVTGSCNLPFTSGNLWVHLLVLASILCRCRPV